MSNTISLAINFFFPYSCGKFLTHYGTSTHSLAKNEWMTYSPLNKKINIIQHDLVVFWFYGIPFSLLFKQINCVLWGWANPPGTKHVGRYGKTLGVPKTC